MKIPISEVDRQIYEMTPAGRAYLEYNNAVGGPPLGLTIGMPNIEELYGGIEGVYRECIEQNKTWEELIGANWDELRE